MIAYALAGTMDFDVDADPLGTGTGGPRVPPRHLADPQEVEAVVASAITQDMFTKDLRGRVRR